MQTLKKYKHLIIVVIAAIAIVIVLFVTNLGSPSSEAPGTLSGTGSAQELAGGDEGGPTASNVEGQEPPNDNQGF